MKKVLCAICLLWLVSGCSEEIGSQPWCETKAEQPKSNWSGQDALDYAKYCVFDEPVGSPSWCNDIAEKPKGDWTANEATGYAKYCVL